MSIEQTKVVDAIGVDDLSDEVILTITDHLKWGGDSDEHLLLLQEKINTYLSFIESGELIGSYPDAKGRIVVINIVWKYPLNEEAKGFIEQFKSIVDSAGISLRFEEFKAV